MRVLFFTAAAMAALLATDSQAIRLEQTMGSGLLAGIGASDTSPIHQYLSELGNHSE